MITQKDLRSYMLDILWLGFGMEIDEETVLYIQPVSEEENGDFLDVEFDKHNVVTEKSERIKCRLSFEIIERMSDDGF